jgi:hypothetical protein
VTRRGDDMNGPASACHGHNIAHIRPIVKTYLVTTREHLKKAGTGTIPAGKLPFSDVGAAELQTSRRRSSGACCALLLRAEGSEASMRNADAPARALELY